MTASPLSALAAAILVIFLIFLMLAALVLRAPRRRKEGGAPKREAPRGVQWDGPRDCYPRPMVEACQTFVRGMIRASRRFGPATRAEREELAAEAARLRRTYDVEVRGEQLLAMRDMEVALEAQTSGARALRHAPELLAASRRGESVIEIAARFRLPPVAALRQILLEEGFAAAAVRSMLGGETRGQMPARLARELPAVFEADLGSSLNAGRIRARSQAYEDAVGAHLRGLGLQFRTENDLRREHLADAASAPRFTPDFLLDPPSAINGRPVCWIDAKDYPLYGSRLVARGLARQAAKYTEAFGPGAMIFSGGLLCNARVAPGAAQPLLLDGSHVGRPAD